MVEIKPSEIMVPLDYIGNFFGILSERLFIAIDDKENNNEVNQS